MSGDVQPRKRKDKRRKKEDVVGQEEAPIPTIVPPQGNEDFNIHVHNDHGTGGGLCAKLVFFILLSALAIFIGSVITQNRGLTDLDTPASESRFANIFSGWIDESINTHDDDHHAVVDFEDKHGDEHEDDDEHQLSDEAHHASEEDAHGSEEDAHGSEEDAHGSEEDAHGSEEDIHESKEENHVSEEDEQEDGKEQVDDDQQVSEEEEQNDGDDDHDDEEQLREQDQEATEEDEQDDGTQENNESQISEEDHNDDGQHDKDNDDDQQDEEQHNDDDNEEQQDDDDDQLDEEHQIDEQDQETNESHENDDIDDNDNTQDDGSNEETADQKDDQDEIEGEQSNEDNNVDNDVMDESENVSEAPSNLDDNPDDSMQEDTFTSKEQEIVEEDSTEANIEDFGEEEVTDNTAGEEEIEKEEIVPELEEDNSSRNAVWTYVTVAVKFGVGVALVVVAHIVLVRKWRSGQQNTNRTAEEEVNVEMSRRNTMIPVSTPDQLEQEIQNAEDEYSEEDELEEESEEEIITPTHRYMQFRSDYSSPSSAEDIVKKRIESVQNAEQNVKYYYENTDQIKQADDDNDEEEEEDEELEEDDVEEIDDGNCEGEILETEGDDVEGEEHEEMEAAGDDVKNEADVEDADAEEEESDEISDVDDDELLKKLEARYGKLSDTRYNNTDDHEYDDVDVEDKYDSKKSAKITNTASLTKEKNVLKTDNKLREKLKSAEKSLTDNVELALSLYTNLMEKLPNNAEVKYGRARALDRLAEMKRSNELLQNAISSYYDILQNSTISNEIFAYVGMRCIDLIRFSGAYSRAIYAHKMLIDRFPNESKYLNELAVTLLTSNRLTEAKRVLQKVLARWPDNGFAQVHYGFILKINENDLSSAIKYLQAGIKTKDPGVIDGRFYFHLGDALIRLGQTTEAIKVYEDGVEQKVFLSKYQRSLYNVNRLTAKPWWSTSDTPYSHFFHMLEANWKIIHDEGVALLNEQKYFTEEKEDLRDTGKWAQFELFVRGFKLLNNCNKCPETCKIIESFPDARDCNRGQVKYSVMHPGTHVWPHCGPTNSRLRAHLGLMIPSGTYIRVAEEIRYWKEGEVILFDDSFEHEVWHNGSGIRLVLIIDVWHPELTDSEKRSLPPI